MFQEITFDAPTLEETPSFYRPITSQEGAMSSTIRRPLEDAGLPVPDSIADLAEPCL